MYKDPKQNPLTNSRVYLRFSISFYAFDNMFALNVKIECSVSCAKRFICIRSIN